MKYRFIKDSCSTFAVKKMCLVLEVASSGYYKWRNNKHTNRTKENTMLLKRIEYISNENKGCYGSPRITRQLKKDGFSCGENRVARIMRKNNISAKTKKRFKITTNCKHKNPIAPNLLNQEFSITGINMVWVSDITYIYTREGWLYLSGVLDLCSKKVIGWSMGERLSKELVIKALRQAISRRGINGSVLLHSDRGSQYASLEYTQLLIDNKLIQSMSGKGNCYDNAVMESFFKTLKTELVYWQDYKTRDDAKKSIFEYIETYYNRKRMHSSIGYMSPDQFENSMNHS